MIDWLALIQRSISNNTGISNLCLLTVWFYCTYNIRERLQASYRFLLLCSHIRHCPVLKYYCCSRCSWHQTNFFLFASVPIMYRTASQVPHKLPTGGMSLSALLLHHSFRGNIRRHERGMTEQKCTATTLLMLAAAAISTQTSRQTFLICAAASLIGPIVLLRSRLWVSQRSII